MKGILQYSVHSKFFGGHARILNRLSNITFTKVIVRPLEPNLGKPNSLLLISSEMIEGHFIASVVVENLEIVEYVLPPHNFKVVQNGNDSNITIRTESDTSNSNTNYDIYIEYEYEE